MTCSGEGCNSNQIVNVKYNLCPNCNSVRTTGCTLAERQRASVLKSKEKQMARSKDTKTATVISRSPPEKKDRGLFIRSNQVSLEPSRYKPVRQQTTKESGIKSKLSVLKKEIELDAIQSNEYYCRGCGKSHPGLDKSHLLSVGQFKHLELIKDNIQLMCREPCHRTWESGSIEAQSRLNCFVDNVVWIHSQDITSYQKFMTRLETFLEDLNFFDENTYTEISNKYHEINTKIISNV